MKRLSVEMVREAMNSTGLKLASGLSLDVANKCGCPIGIVAASIDQDKAFRHALPEIDELVNIVGLNWRYAVGFVRGFDGCHNDCVYDASLVGYVDGLAIREELLIREPSGDLS